MVIRLLRRSAAAIAPLCIAAIAAGFWAALHEGFPVRLVIWNCVPPIAGLLALIVTSGQGRRRRIAAAAFAATAALTSIFFVAAWLFTPLDTDPHSGTTVLVFIYAPLLALGLGILAYAVARSLTMRTQVARS